MVESEGGGNDGEGRKWWRVKGEGMMGSDGGGEEVVSGSAGSHFRSGALIHVCGCLFLFMAGVVTSGRSSSVHGGHRHPWGTIAVPGSWSSSAWLFLADMISI